MPEYKLTYYDVRGYAELSRLLFALAGVEFEDNRLPFTGPGKNVMPPEVKEKAPYGQVPILEFGETILSQSGTIARFLARKFNLHGSSDLESARIDEIMDAAKDYQDSFRPVFMSKTDEEKAAAMKSISEVSTPKYLGKFNEILEKNGTGFFVGSKVSLADVQLFSMLTSVEIMMKVDPAQGYPALQKLVKTVGAIPNIKAWVDKRPKTTY